MEAPHLSSGSDREKWWTEKTVAVVAGSSRGIGLETVRQLAKQGLTVVLTARNHANGLAIAKSVVDEGYPNVHFHQLDVQSDQSVSLLADWLQNKFGGIDILINNAGVIGAEIDWDFWESRGISRLALLSNRSFTEGFNEDYENAKACVDTNYLGTKRMVKALLPLLKPSSSGSRIVNVSSTGGLLQPILFFDGAAQDGLCAAGGVIFINESHYFSLRLNGGRGTNMKAELLALWVVLKVANYFGLVNLKVFGDSRVTIKWASSEFSFNVIDLNYWCARARQEIE